MKNVYFIRHNFSSDDLDIRKEVRDILLKEEYIAIHFNKDEPPDKEWQSYLEKKKKSESPEKKQLCMAGETFRKLKEEGGYVLIQYDLYGKIYIGKISAESEIEYPLREKNNENYNGYKCLKVQDIKCFEITDFPILFAIRPRQQTIAKMGDTGSEIVRQIYEKGRIENKLKFLPPQFQELIVQEWLRSENAGHLRVKYQLILTGKDYPSVDIIGETINGKILFAQVTYHKEVENKNKFDEFKELANSNITQDKKNHIFVMFSNEKNKSDDDNIIFKNLDEIFKWLTEDKEYKKFINKIFSRIDE